MIVPDGFIWQIGAMVLFVIFSKYGCIENAIFGSLNYAVYGLPVTKSYYSNIVMALIHIQKILWKSGKRKFQMVLGIAVVGVYQVVNININININLSSHYAIAHLVQEISRKFMVFIFIPNKQILDIGILVVLLFIILTESYILSNNINTYRKL
eukprot:132281_1